MKRSALLLATAMLYPSWNSLALESRIARVEVPAAIYLEESFDGGTLPMGWTVQQLVGPTATWSVTRTGTNPPVVPYRGVGQAKFNSYDASVNEQARLVSPAINLTGATDPIVTFAMYHDSEFIDDPDSLYVEVSTEDSTQGPWWTTLYGIARPQSAPGWKDEAVPLLGAKGSLRVFVALRGVSKFGNNIYVDQLRVVDSSFHDIGAVAMLEQGSLRNPSLTDGSSGASRGRSTAFRKVCGESPSPVVVTTLDQQSVDFGVVVRNFGTFDESAYEIGWSVDGLIQGGVSNQRTLLPGGSDTISLTLSGVLPGDHLLAAWTILASDSNARNDTARISIQVLDSAVAFYESFNGTGFPPAGWSTINRDGGLLAPWFRGAANSVFPPYEGAGFAADNFQRANANYLDDYLISPPIQGVGLGANYDSLIFWARSAYYPPPAANYPDSLMILLSTGGADTSSFVTLLEYLAVPKTGWVREGYRLTGTVPENSTVRIAFRYLLFGAGTNGPSADFIGLDAVQVRRGIATSVSGAEVPVAFRLWQNYPNPFNPTTKIQFTIVNRQLTIVKVFDVLGREVATLVNGTLEQGEHTVTWDARGLPSGVYFCRLEGSESVQTVKMLLLK